MATITKNKTWADNENVLYTDLNATFDTVYGAVNGNLDNDNIAASAAIEESKIEFGGSSGQVAKSNGTGGITWTDSGDASWIATGETWTYTGADDPVFTLTISGDKTTKYSAGMKVKLTQTTEKFFIIVKVEYSAPNTTVTLYGGTDYDLANATITTPYYSTAKTPVGFSLDATKWEVVVTDTTDRSQSTPTKGTWYNIGTTNSQISVPIGSWNLEYYVVVDAYRTGGWANLNWCYVTLSTANNSESNTSLTSAGDGEILSSGDPRMRQNLTRLATITTTSKTTYYLISKVSTASDPGTGWQHIKFMNAVAAMVIRARCAYL